VFRKGCGLHFYRFPTERERRNQWIAAVNRQNWTPNEYTWICSEHFVSGEKSNNPLAPNYVPTLFEHIKSPVKRRLAARGETFARRQATKRRRLEESQRIECAKELKKKARVKKLDEKRKVEKVCYLLNIKLNHAG